MSQAAKKKVTMRSLLIAFGLPFIFVSIMHSQAFAQESPQDETPEVIVDEFNRGNPRSSGQGFLTATDAGNFEAASNYLDLRNIHGVAASLSGEQLARRLDVIIERAEWVDIDELTDDPSGRSNDGLPPYQYKEDFHPESFVFDTAKVRPALNALVGQPDSLLWRSYVKLKEVATSHGHRKVSFGHRYWFWNLTATRTLEKLQKSGVVTRTNNGQIKLDLLEM